MKKYSVYLEATASTIVEVEAEDEDDAYSKALQQSLPRICAQCSGWGQKIGMDLGEWDLGEGDESIQEVAAA